MNLKIVFSVIFSDLFYNICICIREATLRAAETLHTHGSRFQLREIYSDLYPI